MSMSAFVLMNKSVHTRFLVPAGNEPTWDSDFGFSYFSNEGKQDL